MLTKVLSVIFFALFGISQFVVISSIGLILGIVAIGLAVSIAVGA